MISTLADALASEPDLAPPPIRSESAPMIQTRDENGRVALTPDPAHVPIVAYACEAQGCRRWRSAHMLRDVRASDAFGAARFVCDECEISVGRHLQALFGALSGG